MKRVLSISLGNLRKKKATPGVGGASVCGDENGGPDEEPPRGMGRRGSVLEDFPYGPTQDDEDNQESPGPEKNFYHTPG